MGFREDCLHQEYLFYGVDNNLFKLDDTVWEAEEDPDDGYRSCMGAVVNREGVGVFYRDPLVIVTVEDDPDYDGFKLVDGDKHVWLSFGTDESDDYYPCFHFKYTPKPPEAAPKKKKKVIHDHAIDPLDRLFNQRES